MGLFDDIKQAISLSNSELPVKTFKATLPEIIVTRNTKPSTWFGALPTTTVTMARPEKKKPKSSWRWTTISNPRMRLFTGNSVAQPILTGLGYVADATNKAISGLATSNTTPTGIYSVLSPLLVQTNRQIRQKVENTLNKKVWPTLMPTNYLTALFSEGSLNPYRGAEIKSTWSPTLLLLTVPIDMWGAKKVGLGVGKATEVPRFVVDKAAEAGFQPAKAAVIAREINLATKNNPNISNRTISVKRSNNEITGQPDLVYTLYNEFGEPIGLTNIGGAVFGSGNKTHRMVDGVMSMRNAHKVSEDTYNAAVQDVIDNGGKGLESGWSLMMPLKTLAVTSKFPYTVIGLEFGNPVRLLTGTSERPIPQRVLGNHYLELKPSFEIKYNESTGNFEQIPISNSEPYVSTSLKFFERRPSRISEAERAGKARGLSYYTPEQNKAFLKLINDFAEKYGYPGLKDGEYSAEQLNAYARALIDRHNKFYRGVTLPTNKQDIALIKRVLGENVTEDQILRYVATHTRGKNHPLWISPLSNAFIYGSNGKTAIISRPYKLGRDRTKWFLEGDFNIVETGRGGFDYSNFNGIVYPWLSPKFSEYNPFLGRRTYTEFSRNITPEDLKNSDYYLYMPNGLVQNEYTVMNLPMIFRQWIESKNATGLSGKTPDAPWLLTNIIDNYK